MNHKMRFQKGFSLVIVLSTMILAILVTTGLFVTIKHFMRQSEDSLKYATAQSTTEAAKEAIESWLSFKGMEVVSVFQTYYDNKDTITVRIPLDSNLDLKPSKLQYFSARLVALDYNSMPMQVKIQIDAHGRDGSRQVSNVMYKVSGIYLEEMLNQFSSAGGPEMALWIGNAPSSITSHLKIGNGGMYAGGQMSLNGSYTSPVNGDVIVGKSGAISKLNGCAPIVGNFYTVNPVAISASACDAGPWRISKSFVGFNGFGSNEVGASMVVGEDFYLKSSNTQKILGGTTITVKGNLTLEGNLSIEGDASLIVDGDVTVKSGKITVSGNLIVRGKKKGLIGAQIWNENTTEATQLISEIGSTLTGNNSSKPVPFGFDLNLVPAEQKTTWAEWCTHIKSEIANFQCGTSNTSFNSKGAQNYMALAESDRKNLEKKYSYKGFYIINTLGTDIGHLPSAPLLEGKWMLYQTSGTMELGNQAMDASRNNETFTKCFPSMRNTARVVIWLSGSASVNNFDICGNGTFNGIFFQEGTGSFQKNNATSSTDVFNGNFTLNNSGLIAFSGTGDTYTMNLNQQILDELKALPMTDGTTAGTVIDQRSVVAKYFKIYSPRLRADFLGGFTEQKSLYEMMREISGQEKADHAYDSVKSISKPFLDFSQNGLSMGNGQYATVEELLSALNARVVWFWKGELYHSACSGSFDNNSLSRYSNMNVFPVYTLICNDGTTTVTASRKLAIQVGAIDGNKQTNSVAIPRFSLASGTYSGAQSVSVSTATPGATLYCSLNGIDFDLCQTQYEIRTSQILYAYASKANMNNSQTTSASYVISNVVSTPVFSPKGGVYVKEQSVSLSSIPGATIYYTTDGSTPNTSSLIYTSPLLITSNTTVQAIAVKSNMNESAVGIATYTINKPYLTLIDSSQIPSGCLIKDKETGYQITFNVPIALEPKQLTLEMTCANAKWVNWKMVNSQGKNGGLQFNVDLSTGDQVIVIKTVDICPTYVKTNLSYTRNSCVSSKNSNWLCSGTNASWCNLPANGGLPGGSLNAWTEVELNK